MCHNASYWTQQEHDAFATASSFADLLSIALAILKRMPKPIAQVCGPMTTGGAGNLDENLNIFERAMQILTQTKEAAIFDQLPFEDYRLLRNGKGRLVGNMLTDFYGPIFQSGHISRLYFLPDWEKSRGASWEHDQGRQLRLDIVYLGAL